MNKHSETLMKIGQVKLLREMDEEWASETPNRVMTPMQVDDESDNSAVGVESEDDGDGQFVDYGQRNK